MKVLYVTSKVPYPVADGGCFAMMQLIKSIQDEQWEIDGLIFSTPKHPFTADSEKTLNTFFKSITTVKVNTAVKPIQALWNFLTKKNYNLKRFKSAELETQLRKQLSNGYDLVLLDSLFAAALIPKLKQEFKARFVIRAHNVEHEIWRTLAKEEKSKLKRRYLTTLYQTLKKEEAQILNAADQIWAMSEADVELMKKKDIITPIHYIPVAIEIPDVHSDLKHTTCFHLGSMNWQPNIEAVNYLFDHLWRTSSALPPLQIAGSHSEYLLNTTLPNNVSIIGKVPDVNRFMQSAGILVSPIQSGSGIRIKLLEALALGVPCITTSLGAAGIHPQEAGILLAETPEEWIAQIEKLTNSEALRIENSQKSIAYISNKHSFAKCKSLIRTALGC